jgi:outer membrane protein assembly factor BamB
LARPAISGDSLWVGSAASDALYRLQRRDGRIETQYPAKGAVADQPILRGDTVLFSDSAGYVWRYPIAGGEPLWITFMGAPVLSTPAWEGETIYVSTIDNAVVALAQDTGEVLWRYSHPADAARPSELELYGAPSPLLVHDRVVAGFSDGRLVALDPETGDLLWQKQVGEGRYPDVLAPPVGEGRTVYAGGFSTPFLAVDVETRAVRWRLNFGTSSGALLQGNTLYVGGTDGRLRAINHLTGAVTWTWDSGTTGALTRPVKVEAGLLIGSTAGGLWLIDPESGERVWTFDAGFKLDGVSVAPVAKGSQILAVSNAGRLYAMISVSEESEESD